jgi:NDP-sugar pyrophosphorylase family protein
VDVQADLAHGSHTARDTLSMQRPLPVILAGGLGTRLGSLTQGLPKPMVSVAGRPLLEHLLQQLAAQGFTDALLLVGHRADVIEKHFGDGRRLGLSLHYSREAEPLGTGGAFRLARPLIRQRFLMLYGDLYRPIDYAALAMMHEGNALAVYPYVEGLTTIACANVGLDPSGRRVVVYAKSRPELDLSHVDAGFGFFLPEVLDLLPDGVSNLEQSVYPILASRGELDAIPVDRTFVDIGNPSDLAAARQQLASWLGS